MLTASSQRARTRSPPRLITEEINFFLSGLPPEGLVSTGEPSESPDYFQVLIGLIEYFTMSGTLRYQGARKPHRFELILEIFAVLEWKVQEHPHYERQLAVQSRRNSRAGQFPRLRVGRERSCRPAEHVSRELIQQQNERQTTSWFGAPVIKTAARGIFISSKEPRRTKLVELRSREEPARLKNVSWQTRSGTEPEEQDAFRSFGRDYRSFRQLPTHFIQQRPGVLQVRGIEALCEPAVNPCEH